MSRSFVPLRCPRSVLPAAALALLAGLADAAAASYLPGWAQSVASSFCRGARAGLDQRQALLQAIEEHKAVLIGPADADRAATTRTLVFAVMERCPEFSRSQGSTGPAATGAARPGGRFSGACSSYILVGGRRQCL